MKDGIKPFSELNANEILSYTSDKIWLKRPAYLAEIFEKFNNLNVKLQEKGTNIIRLRDESASILFEFVNRVVKQCKATLLCLRNCQMFLKNWRTWWEFEDFCNRPPSIHWNWVPAIFPWAQAARSSTYAKFFLYLSGYNQYSRWITGPILWSLNDSSVRDIFM